MHTSVRRRSLSVAFAVATIATAAALLLLLHPGHAARAAAVPTLALGQAFRQRLNAGSRITVRYPPQSLRRGIAIDLLAVSRSGAILGRLTATAGASEVAQGYLSLRVPAVSSQPAYWIALAPQGLVFPMRLQIAPEGPKPSGTALAAIVTGVPADQTVYLLGERPLAQDPGRIAAYIAPSSCIPNPSTGGMTICNFHAPPGYGSQAITFTAFSTSGQTASLPYDNLPEAVYPSIMPVLAIVLAWLRKPREVSS